MAAYSNWKYVLDLKIPGNRTKCTNLQGPRIELSREAALKVGDVPEEGLQEVEEGPAAEGLQGAVGVEAGGVVAPGLGAGRAALLRGARGPLQHLPQDVLVILGEEVRGVEVGVEEWRWMGALDGRPTHPSVSGA